MLLSAGFFVYALFQVEKVTVYFLLLSGVSVVKGC